MEFILESPVFQPNGPIPPAYTCEGADISPPLNWSGAPIGTKSFALVVEDPDAPDPRHPKMLYVHWVIYNIPYYINELPENIKVLPEGAEAGLTDFGRTGYGGPCPPIGVHRYYHRLYALDVVLDASGPLTKAALLKKMEGHVLAQAVLMGTYKCQKKDIR